MSFTGERKGRLIVFEGIDGTGKSTHIGHLRKYLEGKGLEVVQSFEPTRGRWGRMLRDSAVTGRLSVEEEVALFLKDRREHVETLIAPALARGGMGSAGSLLSFHDGLPGRARHSSGGYPRRQ